MNTPLPIPKVPFNKNGKNLESLLRKALFDFKMLEQAESLAVALSGGKDSLTLLFLLKAVLGYGVPNLPLSAIHVEGDFSCGANISTTFLKKICEQLEVPLFIAKSKKNNTKKTENKNNPEISKKDKEKEQASEKNKETATNCYSCSRNRRKLIFEVMKKEKITTVAFGHHSNDVAQTLLLNLLQKGEFAAMLPKIKMLRFSATIIRPLIYIKETEITTFAQHYGFLRATCNCPKGATSKRKEADNLIDILTKTFPHARSNLALSALLYGSDKALKI